jgi:CheY-like chemotaxis protein
MKILAVDDDPIILELLSQFIGEFGQHNLTTVTSGAEALEAVRAARVAKYDCFLFDIQMPEMDGIELTSEIRKLSDYKATPIIMLTAMSDKQYIDAAFSAGSTDYITKPFEFLDLKGRLSLAESLVQARQSRTRKVFAAQATGAL